MNHYRFNYGNKIIIEVMDNPFEIIMAKLMELESKIDSIAMQTTGGRYDETFSRKEAAAYLKVHVDTVTRLAVSGQLKKSNIGRNMKFKRSDLDDYLKENMD